ncbi:unnamed protein product [Ambrosiozyma monospora]|uniref:Unnamed protein product n=1 Tax=Ambrosiozyma monospora TaxID=43982 RepID=A0A9W6Z2L5_AMBMO|nr:unnamed protein product [Ambrosiozyma monospora]
MLVALIFALTVLSTISPSLARFVLPASLFVNSSNPALSGSGIYGKHSGEGVDYLYLGDKNFNSSQLLMRDGTQLYTNRTGNAKYFNVDDPYAKLTVAGPNSKKIGFVYYDDKHCLTVGGDISGFFACKNTSDPYNYSVHEFELMYYPTGGENDNCIPVNVYKIQ